MRHGAWSLLQSLADGRVLEPRTETGGLPFYRWTDTRRRVRNEDLVTLLSNGLADLNEQKNVVISDWGRTTLKFKSFVPEENI